MRTRFVLPCLVMAAALGANGAEAQKKASPLTPAEKVARGKYLVRTSGCSDCHTPHKAGPAGPEADETRAYSGHPQDLTMPPAPQLPPGPWVFAGSGTFTAWSGPWGVSFTRNLTADKETGLGGWTEQNFVDTIRTGRRMGKGRPILPPMPIPAIQNYTDEDLRAIFAYLQSLPPVKNAVPEPLPPATAVVAPVVSK